MTVSAWIDPGSASTLKVAADGKLLWDGAQCGAATTTNTDFVSVAGAAGSTETLTLDQSDGFFGPGFSEEYNLPEIEMATSLGDTTDKFVVIGTAGDDTIAAGVNGVALNADGDLDITFNPGVFVLEMHGLAGHDLLTARGLGGAGLAFRGPATIYGGTGNDELIGAWLDDAIYGEEGNDVLAGFQLNDLLVGGPGDDELIGSDDNDTMIGGPGSDRFNGGFGNDVLMANDTEADSHIHGGPGTDSAFVDVVDPATIAVESTTVDPGPPPPPPPPGGACVYDAPSGAVSASIAAGAQATLSVVGGAIHFGATPSACGAATTANTDSITVTGPAGSVERLVIDQTGGAFAPGATAEASGVSEIEIAVNLGDATDETVVHGTNGNDTLVVGTKGVGLNNDSDEDVTFGVLPGSVELIGGGGQNVLSARGGFGTGQVFPGRVTLRAGDQGDTLDGSNLGDLLVGGAGPDTIDASGGDDELHGGGGNDVLKGGDGNDTIIGGPGADDMNGSFGNDTLDAADGTPDALIHGGGGTDSATIDNVDPAPIAVESVTVGAGPPPPPPPPGGACTYTAGAASAVAVIPAGGQATLTVVGGAIHFGESPSACGAATTANTDTITVSGPAGSIETLVIDQTGGALAPGATAETGMSEIEINVNLGDAGDKTTIVGTPGNDTLAAGTSGVGLNNDGDVDVTFGTNPSSLELNGGGGADLVRARGGYGAGQVFPGAVTLRGGDGDDTIEGSDLPSLLVGGSGNDTIEGGAANDDIQGGDGNDRLTGSHGDDTLTGGAGEDELYGNAGEDVLNAVDGGPDLLDGGASFDRGYRDITNSDSLPFDGTPDTLVGVEGGLGTPLPAVLPDVPAAPGACVYDAVRKMVAARVAAGGESSLVVVGGELRLDGAACGGATTTNTDRVRIAAAPGSVERFTVDQRGGRFAPGAKIETDHAGYSEIEIWLELGDANDEVVVYGTPEDDLITIDGNGDFALGPDWDRQLITLPAPGLVEVHGGDGNDEVDPSYNTPRYPGTARLFGDEGNDKLWATVSGSYLDGGAGDDWLIGLEGNDVIIGGAGVDRMTAGRGDDVVHADDGVADQELLGGSGTDTVYYDAGLDSPLEFEILHGL